MKYCKNCHILYSSCAAACPKCGIKPQRQQEQTPADGKAVRRDWLWLVIGIPALIGAIYLIALFIKAID